MLYISIHPVSLYIKDLLVATKTLETKLGNLSTNSFPPYWKLSLHRDYSYDKKEKTLNRKLFKDWSLYLKGGIILRFYK